MEQRSGGQKEGGSATKVQLLWANAAQALRLACEKRWVRKIREGEYLPRLSKLLQIKVIDGAQSTRVVRAGTLNVAGLLAAVANTLGGCLLGAVTGQVTDLAAVVGWVIP